MCFNQPMTGVMAISGLALSYFVYRKTKNKYLSLGILYFTSMEILQFFQYFWIDQCDMFMNKILTAVGWFHIAFQPAIAHMYFGSTMLKDEQKIAYKMVTRLGIVAAVCLSMRIVLALFGLLVWDNVDGFGIGYDNEGRQTGWNHTCGTAAEWFRGKELCTYSGRRHLAWSIPLTTPTYFQPSMFVYNFFMFAPLIVMWERGIHLVVAGTILFFCGPLVSCLLTDNTHEQGAIWCFFSIANIAIQLIYSVKYDVNGGWYQTKTEEKKK